MNKVLNELANIFVTTILNVFYTIIAAIEGSIRPISIKVSYARVRATMGI